MTIAVDVHRLTEDDRIKLIGESVMKQNPSSAEKPVMNGFFVENDAKADRYVAKLQRRFPGLRIVGRGPGPGPGTILVRIAGPLQ